MGDAIASNRDAAVFETPGIVYYFTRRRLRPDPFPPPWRTPGYSGLPGNIDIMQKDKPTTSALNDQLAGLREKLSQARRMAADRLAHLDELSAKIDELHPLPDEGEPQKEQLDELAAQCREVLKGGLCTGPETLPGQNGPAVAELAASEARYRNLVERMPAVIYSAALDEHSTTMYISPQSSMVLGYPADFFTSNPANYAKSIHPDDRDWVLETLQHCHQSGEHLAIEYRMIKPDGGVIWVRDEADIITSQPGGRRLLQGIMQDVSDRRMAQSRLSREAVISASLADLAHEIISLPNAEQVSRIVLHKARELTGSEYGFTGYASQGGQSLDTLTFSQEVESACVVQTGKMELDGECGLWGWSIKSKQAVVCNQPKKDPRAQGLPPGHLEIRRFLSVPVILKNQLVGHIGLGQSSL
jgi:PAS domain S-box-containing protein